MPGSSDGTEKAPVSFVTAPNEVPVALFVTATVAPGITPPAESTAVPESEAVAVPCADTRVAVDNAASPTPRASRESEVVHRGVLRFRRNLRSRNEIVNAKQTLLSWFY